jgi:arylsulfatase A-like enzyme
MKIALPEFHSDGNSVSWIELLTLPIWLALSVGAVDGLATSVWIRFCDFDWLWVPAVVYASLAAAATLATAALSPFLTLRRAILGGWFCFCLVVTYGREKLLWPGIGKLAAILLAIGVASATTRLVHRHYPSLLHYQKMTLRWLILTVAVVATGTAVGRSLREMAAERSLPEEIPEAQNVLIVIVDTLRADHLSMYGYGRDTSPNLSRLAAQGVLFENAVAPSSWTLPSHASMMTGVYPREHRTEKIGAQLGTQWPTIAEALNRVGYRTAAFSGNHGFFSRHHGLARGFLHFDDHYKNTYANFSTPLVGRLRYWAYRLGAYAVAQIGFQSAADINHLALKWIDGAHNRPFFVVLNYFDVHEYLAPEPFGHAFTSEKHPTKKNLVSLTFDRFVKLNDREMAEQMAAYDGAVKYVDNQIQDLLNALQSRGLLNTTTVIVTSDHGEEFGGHGLLLHGNALYRGAIHVPLIVWHPGSIPAGIRVSRPVSTVSLPRTVLGFAGPAATNLFPGRSLQDLWSGAAPELAWPDPISELAKLPFNRDWPSYNGPMHSVMTPEWHYILQGSKEQLYAWKTDPQELHDQAEEQPRVCATLREELTGQQQPILGSTKTDPGSRLSAAGQGNRVEKTRTAN